MNAFKLVFLARACMFRVVVRSIKIGESHIVFLVDPYYQVLLYLMTDIAIV